MKKAKRQHFANLDVNFVLDNRMFWQNVKTLSSNKIKAKPTVRLTENDKMIDNKTKIAKIFNKYFVNIVKNLGILTGPRYCESMQLYGRKKRHIQMNAFIISQFSYI